MGGLSRNKEKQLDIRGELEGGKHMVTMKPDRVDSASFVKIQETLESLSWADKLEVVLPSRQFLTDNILVNAVIFSCIVSL